MEILKSKVKKKANLPPPPLLYTPLLFHQPSSNDRGLEFAVPTEFQPSSVKRESQTRVEIRISTLKKKFFSFKQINFVDENISQQNVICYNKTNARPKKNYIFIEINQLTAPLDFNLTE